MEYSEIDNILKQVAKLKTRLEEHEIVEQNERLKLNNKIAEQYTLLNAPKIIPVNEKEEYIKERAKALADYLQRYCAIKRATRGIAAKEVQYQIGVTSAYRFDQILFAARKLNPEIDIIKSVKGKVILEWQNGNTKSDIDLTPEELSILNAKVVTTD